MAETANKKRRFETYALVVLLAFLALVVYVERGHEAAFVGIQIGDTQFRPLGVSDPALRLDLLARIQNEEYNGAHRNIFAAAPLPPPIVRPANVAPLVQTPAIPQPVAPPPLVVPATLYGIVTEVSTGRKKAVFSGGENEVYVVLEGGTLLSLYRVIKIGINSVDIEEISSGRKTTMTLAPPVDASQPMQAQQ